MTPVCIIAEAGVNHDGCPQQAKKLIDAAKSSGADAVKFQLFDPDSLVAPGTPKVEYQKRQGALGESQRAMLERLVLPPGSLEELFEYAQKQNIEFLCTPFGENEADQLQGLGVSRFKVSSGDLTHRPFLEHLAGLGKPILLSTGMAYLEEVQDAVRWIQNVAPVPLTLLHCTSAYPAPDEDVHLKALLVLQETFSLPIGYSDHTLGCEIALGAVALGATVIEKHFTLDSTLPGPDHKASLEPQALTQMVRGIRRLERALGSPLKKPQPSEQETRKLARRSLHSRVALPPGSTLAKEHLVAVRPEGGLPPSRFRSVQGTPLVRAINPGDALTESHLVFHSENRIENGDDT